MNFTTLFSRTLKALRRCLRGLIKALRAFQICKYLRHLWDNLQRSSKNFCFTSSETYVSAFWYLLKYEKWRKQNFWIENHFNEFQFNENSFKSNFEHYFIHRNSSIKKFHAVKGKFSIIPRRFTSIVNFCNGNDDFQQKDTII